MGKSQNVDLTQESELDLRVSHVCANCGQEIKAARRRLVLPMVKLFGIGDGRRLCYCKQFLLKGWGPKKLILDPLRDDWPCRK